MVVTGIKFKPVGKIYYFNAGKLNIEDNMGVIVETERGIEYGEVVFAKKEVKKDEIVGELKNIIRIASEKDYGVLEKNNALAINHTEVARNLIKKHKLDMKLIDAEYTFDASKIIFTFTAEGRVDFRELVKELATKLKTRIELRQVGARDASKIIGGLGPCGRPICCCNHMREFNKVSIKMAKNQGLALNPSKINGVCGRLMCCLAYENDFYSDANKTMPKIGKKVITPEGEGVAIYNNILKQLVTVRLYNNGNIETKEFEASVIKRPDNCKNCPNKEHHESKTNKQQNDKNIKTAENKNTKNKSNVKKNEK